MQFTALYADGKGEIYDAPGYQALGRSGQTDTLLEKKDMIPLPDGAELMFLPGRPALLSRKGKTEVLAETLTAVAAILPVGYTRTHLPAFRLLPGAPPLPLFGYTAAALYKDQIYVAAMKTDDNEKWHPYRYNTPEIAEKTKKLQALFPDNRLVKHLANCSLNWHCCTAQNLFYHRWEAGIPVSQTCNANCFGCISLQPSECCPSPQTRLDFAPTAAEVAAVGLYHLQDAPEPIISFGQGCEGEPSLAADTIAEAIGRIRRQTGQGIININTNAGFTKGIQKITDAGLNSMRVSMISAVPATFQAYYRAAYTLEAVKESIAYAKQHGVYVSVNMLLMPGLNDRKEELAAWIDFIRETGVDMVQLRNLNIDPDALKAILPAYQGTTAGVREFIRILSQEFPRLKIGNFSKYEILHES